MYTCAWRVVCGEPVREESHAHRRPEPALRLSNPLRAERNRGRESPAALPTHVFSAPGTRQAEGARSGAATSAPIKAGAQRSARTRVGHGVHVLSSGGEPEIWVT